MLFLISLFLVCNQLVFELQMPRSRHRTTDGGCVITELVMWWLKIICIDNIALHPWNLGFSYLEQWTCLTFHASPRPVRHIIAFRKVSQLQLWLGCWREHFLQVKLVITVAPTWHDDYTKALLHQHLKYRNFKAKSIHFNAISRSAQISSHLVADQ